MGIQSLIQNGVNQATPFSKLISTNTPGANQWTTVLNINGKGFLSSAIVRMSNTGGACIRVTIDGVVVHYTTGTPTAKVGGLEQISSVEYSSGIQIATYGMYYPPTAIKQYPLTDQSDAVVLLSNPIPFNSSLLVEVANTTTGNQIYSDLRGGTY